MNKSKWLQYSMKNKKHDNRVTIVFFIDFLVTREGLTGGTERQLIEMINHLDQSRFRPILFCLQEVMPNPFWNAVKCEKHLLYVYSLASIHGAKAFFLFTRFLRKNSVDIVQTYFHDSTLFGTLAAKLAGVKMIISCRRDQGFWYERKLLRNMRLANMLTDRVLVNCEAVKGAVVQNEKVLPEKIDVIHNGVDLVNFDKITPVNLQKEFPSVQDKDKIVGMVANYNREVKRTDLFVLAAAEVVKHFDDVKFLIIGGGRLENELRALTTRLGLEDRVILGGKKEPAAPYIKSFDIGALTSDSEGFSNVLLEYMAAGIPIVATDVGGNSEIVQNERMGLLIPKGNHNALANAISTLLNDNSQRFEMGRRGRAHVVENFSWQKKIKEIESYYLKLLES